jgi:hypothetical protein
MIDFITGAVCGGLVTAIIALVVIALTLPKWP